MHNALKHFTLIFSTWVWSLEEKYSEWDVIVQCRCDCGHDIHLLSASIFIVLLVVLGASLIQLMKK